MKPTEMPERQSGAIFDATGRYRYTLWRRWCIDLPQVVFIMLNPSTADEQRNDPTIRRCLGFARTWGFGSVEVVNLFAYRTTSPRELLKVDDPIGEENNHFLTQAIEKAACVVVGWGVKGTLFGRNKYVTQLLTDWQHVQCLGRTKEGHPRHPLYVKGSVEPVTFSITKRQN